MIAFVSIVLLLTIVAMLLTVLYIQHPRCPNCGSRHVARCRHDSYFCQNCYRNYNPEV